MIENVKNIPPWTYTISDLNGEIRTFYEKILQKTNKKEFRIEGDKLYVEWKEYNKSFNSWNDKKDII